MHVKVETHMSYAVS